MGQPRSQREVKIFDGEPVDQPQTGINEHELVGDRIIACADGTRMSQAALNDGTSSYG